MIIKYEIFHFLKLKLNLVPIGCFSHYRQILQKGRDTLVLYQTLITINITYNKALTTIGSSIPKRK